MTLEVSFFSSPIFPFFYLFDEDSVKNIYEKFDKFDFFSVRFSFKNLLFLFHIFQDISLRLRLMLSSNIHEHRFTQ